MKNYIYCPFCNEKINKHDVWKKAANDLGGNYVGKNEISFYRSCDYQCPICKEKLEIRKRIQINVELTIPYRSIEIE